MIMPSKSPLSLLRPPRRSSVPSLSPGYSRGHRSSIAAGPSLHNATLTRSAINESLAICRHKNTRIQLERCVSLGSWRVALRAIVFHESLPAARGLGYLDISNQRALWERDRNREWDENAGLNMGKKIAWTYSSQRDIAIYFGISERQKSRCNSRARAR